MIDDTHVLHLADVRRRAQEGGDPGASVDVRALAVLAREGVLSRPVTCGASALDEHRHAVVSGAAVDLHASSAAPFLS